MRVVVFGCGPMPCEPEFAVTAPGARTWQILQTVLHGVRLADSGAPEVVVVALDPTERERARGVRVFEVPLDVGQPPDEPVIGRFSYVALGIEAFRRVGAGEWPELLRIPPDAIVATGSAQPYATAALYARAVERPLWVDVFGDPLAELQSRAELLPEHQQDNDTLSYHTWKLLMEALLQGDVFSALSGRQRYALIGHLGAAGRLNRSTRCYEFVHTIPYGVFPLTAPPFTQRRDHGYFVVMWCGSFNTWMDSATLAAGLVKAWRVHRQLRFLVVGGQCAGYSEKTFEDFREAIRREQASEIVRLVDWQPWGALERLYAEADVGLSIDRATYEAVLGSRTRLVHFLLAGLPVISTCPTELAADLAERGFVLPFSLADAEGLADRLSEAIERANELRELGRRGREYVLERYHGRIVGAPLMEWLAAPGFAPDKRGPAHTLDPANPATSYWQAVLDEVRTI